MEFFINLILTIIFGALYLAVLGVYYGFMVAFGWFAILVCGDQYCGGDTYGQGFYRDAVRAYLLAGGLYIAYVALPLIKRAPQVLQALHFLFVPHPADRHIAKTPSLETAKRTLDVKSLAREAERLVKTAMPPAYISENMRRKAEAHAARLRKERELLREAIARERVRDAYEEKRRR